MQERQTQNVRFNILPEIIQLQKFASLGVFHWLAVDINYSLVLLHLSILEKHAQSGMRVQT